MKKTYKQKLESNKHLYEIDKEHLNKKIDMLNKYIDDIRAKNMELITSNEEFKKKTTSITVFHFYLLTSLTKIFKIKEPDRREREITWGANSEIVEFWNNDTGAQWIFKANRENV